MAKLLNQRCAVRLLRRHEWRIGVRARHGIKMTKPGERPVILPNNHGRDYGKGMTQAILKQAGIESMEDQSWSSQLSSTRSAGASGRRSASCRDASRQAER